MSATRRESEDKGYFQWDDSASLSSAANGFFRQNGYVILTNFCTASETQELRTAAGKILDDFRKNTPKSASVFTTSDQNKKVLAKYFLDSSSNISCFLEEKQHAESEAPAVNKIGHALHELSPAFARFSWQPKIAAVASALGLRRALVVQSMYILKNPFVGGEVKSHRDSTFVYSATGDTGATGACLGLWWALEHSTEENGCLWAVPGSHRDELALRFEINAEKNGTTYVGMENTNYAMDQFVPLPMRPGDLILLHGAVVHMSKENTSAKSRHAYSVHLVDEEISPRCWLQRPAEMPFKLLAEEPIE